MSGGASAVEVHRRLGRDSGPGNIVTASHGKIGSWARLGALAALLVGIAPVTPPMQAQSKVAPAQTDPAATLSATLTAACRRDETAFAIHLTSQTAAVFRKLPEAQR